MKKLIVFLIRKRLGLKLNEKFRFEGQKSKSVYYFTKTNVIKEEYGMITLSNVSLNWLLNDECKVIKQKGALLWL